MFQTEPAVTLFIPFFNLNVFSILIPPRNVRPLDTILHKSTHENMLGSIVLTLRIKKSAKLFLGPSYSKQACQVCPARPARCPGIRAFQQDEQGTF